MSQITWAIFIFLTGFVSYGEGGGICPIDFVEHSDVCVNVLITPLLNTWKQTQTKCLDMKASMLMVKSVLEWKNIVAEAASQLQSIPAGLWLGLNYTKRYDKYYWFDGAVHSPNDDWSLWAPEETDQQPDRDKCALIERTGEDDRPFEWILVDCDNRHMMGIGVCVVPIGDYPDGTEYTTISLCLMGIGFIAVLLGIRWIWRIRRKKAQHVCKFS